MNQKQKEYLLNPIKKAGMKALLALIITLVMLYFSVIMYGLVVLGQHVYMERELIWYDYTSMIISFISISGVLAYGSYVWIKDKYERYKELGDEE